MRSGPGKDHKNVVSHQTDMSHMTLRYLVVNVDGPHPGNAVLDPNRLASDAAAVQLHLRRLRVLRIEELDQTPVLDYAPYHFNLRI